MTTTTHTPGTDAKPVTPRKSTAKKATARKRQTATKPKPSSSKPTAATTTKPKAGGKRDTPDHKAATIANAALFGGQELKMSPISAPAIAGMRDTLKHSGALAKRVNDISAPALAKLARGTSKPTSEQREISREITSAFGQRVYGLNGANTRNKMVGRRVWCALHGLRTASK